jgi:hypothetical protein
VGNIAQTGEKLAASLAGDPGFRESRFAHAAIAAFTTNRARGGRRVNEALSAPHTIR